MSRMWRGVSTLCAVVTVAVPAWAGPPVEISNFDFTHFVPDASLVAPQITLDGPVVATQNFVGQGAVEAQGSGFVFPDGTLQSTAAAPGLGVTANSGLYDNRIADVTPPDLYSEVCFKGGQVFSDIHSISESTAGGLCLPGDLGWIIERNQSTAAKWSNARVACLLKGMRLPEPFEWVYSCDNAGDFGLNQMTGDWEWASNETNPQQSNSGISGTPIHVAGNSDCSSGGLGWLTRSSGAPDVYTFRCLR